nr:hypothetical protein [Tanacetum cinerariifolium]
KLEEDLGTHFQDFQNTFESSYDSTNVVNAPRNPFVVKQDHGSFVDKIICDLNKAPDSPHLHTFSPNQFHCFHCKDVLGDVEVCQRCTCISANSSQNPPHIDERCYECGDALDGIFCQQCTSKSCGKGAHTGFNCPPKVLIISNPEPCNQTMNNEPPQTSPSFDPTCHFEKETSLPCVSKPNFVDESPNVFNHPPQPPIYSCEFYGANAQQGHFCTPQVPFIYPEPGYSQDFNFPLDQFGDFHPQQYLCCDNREGLHETFQCQPMNQNFYNSNSSGFDQTKTPQFPVVHPPPQETGIKISHDQENDAFGNEQYKLEDIQELFRKLLNDVQNIHEELAEYINIRDGIASPHDSELVSLEVEKIVIPKDEEVEDDNLREKLLKVNLLIAKIEALKDNPTPSSEFLTKSSSTSPKPFLEKTGTFDNSLPEFENFCFDLEKISSGSTTTHSDISLPDYEAFSFYDDHIKKISSGSTTTYSDISLSEYDSFIFNLSNDQFPPTDRSNFTHEEFGDELAHIISPPEYDCFYFGNFPNPGEWISILNSVICENLFFTTRVNLPVEDDHSPLLAYALWIFLAYLTYPVIPPHLHSFRNKDTIFDPGITINRFYSFKLGLSHRCGTFKKFNTHRSHLNESPMEMLFSTLFPMDQ